MVTRRPGMQEEAKRLWGEVPTGSFDELERRRRLFVSLFQMFFGMTEDEAEREIEQWITPPPPAGSAG